MTFGGYDSDMITSEITWNSLVNRYSYWEVTISNAVLGNTQFFSGDSVKAYFDTGTQTMGMPNQDF